MMGLESRALQPEVSASREGGILVGELQMMQQEKPLSPDRSAWKLRVNGKTVAAKADALAPGLVVYRPPAGATSFELLDGSKKRAARAKVATKTPELLEAPRVHAVISGISHGIHPSRFVNVDLDAKPPKGAVVLVLSKSKGPALSWGQVSPDGLVVNVYTTAGGCVSTFSDGTVMAQPGDLVTAFWVDDLGRRSRVSPPTVVDKAP